MRDTRYLAGAVLLISMLYVSCGREMPSPRPSYTVMPGEQRKPSTEAELELVERIRDASAVLAIIYEDPDVAAEVNAAIATGYYEDERVLLADLIFPEKSALYKQVRAKQVESGNAGKAEVRWGLFSKRFREAAAEVLSPGQAEKITESAADASGSGYFSGAGISIYYPYSEEFGREQPPLVVPATVEADWVDVPDPACPYEHEHTGSGCRQIRIDEEYVQERPVHIIGAGAKPSQPASATISLASGGLHSPALIYLGKVKCTRQYDRLFSFTGNGGGSELKFIRGEAYATLNNNQQVTDTEFDIISVYFKRRDIRKEREKSIYAIWDSDWEPERTEQVFGIYEEDTQGEREFRGSVKTQLEHPLGETEITPVSYSLSVRTQDAIIRQINWNRESFFRYNRSGLAGCGVRNGSTWYDCRLSVAYSLPEL